MKLEINHLPQASTMITARSIALHFTSFLKRKTKQNKTKETKTKQKQKQIKKKNPTKLNKREIQKKRQPNPCSKQYGLGVAHSR